MLIEPLRPSVTIQTSKGNPIPHEPGYELTAVDSDNKFKAIRSRFPESQLIRLRKMPTGAYNCHGMTFFCRRGWIIDEAAINLVLRDDGFSPVSPNEVLAGDIILYLSGDNEIAHSGVVTRVDSGLIAVPWVLSKWGDAGEYLHRFNHCPYYEDSPRVKYMRES